MRSGAIVKKVELWKKDVSKNNFGEYAEEWKFVKKMNSYTDRRSGRQTVVNDEIFDSISVRIKVRNQHDIREMDRVKYFNNMYEIDFIQPDLSERWLTLHCSRINE